MDAEKSGGRAQTPKSATADDTSHLQAMEPDNPVERALLEDADTMLADFAPGDPGKNLQTLIPTPEWKAFTKAAQARGASISLMLRIAARQHLAWLAAYRSPAEIAATRPAPPSDVVGVEVENARLRNALAPFAKIADFWSGRTYRDPVYYASSQGTTETVKITMEDCRLARAALSAHQDARS